MTEIRSLLVGSTLAPAVLMLATMALAVALGRPPAAHPSALWRAFGRLSAAGLLAAVAALALRVVPGAVETTAFLPGLADSTPAAWMAVLVQGLGLVIGTFSARYLEGERHQARYVAAFAGVLASVHVLLLADHWAVLIAAWALTGVALQRLLCFYPERAFARLAAHKKRLADRAADALLVVAAGLAWADSGSGSLSALDRHLAVVGTPSLTLQAAAVCLVFAVMLRTALLPAHGWLIQVMEAPTPVSALLHAGVVNLGGFLLIRFAPLIDAVPAARWLLVVCGLTTALLAGLVMLTRVSIKVRLAWSTVAQMGFMVLECGLGLYTLAALHLVGHSLYKAHAFLSASSVVQASKVQTMRGAVLPSPASLAIAPVGALALVLAVQSVLGAWDWPWWWSGVLALAWAPLLWAPAAHEARQRMAGTRLFAGIGLVIMLTVAAVLVHALPLGVTDAPMHAGGVLALLGMGAMYACLVIVQRDPQRLAAWRRWSYAGFYVDEFYTRLALRLWPTQWTPETTLPTR